MITTSGATDEDSLALLPSLICDSAGAGAVMAGVASGGAGAVIGRGSDFNIYSIFLDGCSRGWNIVVG